MQINWRYVTFLKWNSCFSILPYLFTTLVFLVIWYICYCNAVESLGMGLRISRVWWASFSTTTRWVILFVLLPHFGSHAWFAKWKCSITRWCLKVCFCPNVVWSWDLWPWVSFCDLGFMGCWGLGYTYCMWSTQFNVFRGLEVTGRY